MTFIEPGTPTIQQLRALIAFSRGASYAEIGGGERQAGYQLLRRLELTLFGPGAEHRIVAAGGTGLTAAGEAIAEAAMGAVDELGRFHRCVAELRGREYVRVVSVPAVVPLVDRAWNQWAKGNAHRTVVLGDISDEHRADYGSRLLRDIADGRADVALTPGHAAPVSGVEQSELYTWRLRLITPHAHPFRRHSSVDMLQLLGDPSGLLLSPPGHESRDRFEDALDDLGTKAVARVVFESSSVELLEARSLTGRGIAVVAGDSLPVQRITREGEIPLPVLTVRGRELRGSISVCTTSRPPPAVEDFVAELRREASSLFA